MAPTARREPETRTDDVDRLIAQRARVTPNIDTEGMAVFGRVCRIAAQIAPHMEALFAHHGLERGEFDVLATLQRSGPPYRLTPTEIYTSLMLSSGGLTHRLKRLESARLVKRAPSREDGRSLTVELTAEGLKRAQAAFAEDMKLESSWLGTLPAEQRRMLADLLRALSLAVPPFEKPNHPDA